MALMFEVLDSAADPLIGRFNWRGHRLRRGLAAICDIVVAAEDASFAFTDGEARHPAGRHCAVRARQYRPLGGARAVPDRGRDSRARRSRELGLVHADRHRPTTRNRIHREDVNDLLISAPRRLVAARSR